MLVGSPDPTMELVREIQFPNQPNRRYALKISKTIIYAAVISFLISIAAFLFAKGGSIIEYLYDPIVNCFLVCLLLLPYWYKKIKQDTRINLRLLMNVAIAAGTAIIISLASVQLFFIVSLVLYGPPI